MTEFLFSNVAVSTLDAPITDASTTLVLAAGHGVRFPNPGVGQAFVIVVQSDSVREIMHCTGRSVDTLTVVRAQEGTTASAFPAGASVQMLLTAGTAARFVQGPKTIPQNHLLGRVSSGTGIVEAVELGTGLEFSSGTLRVSSNYALKNADNNFSVPQTVPNATAGGHAMNRDASDARYVRPDQQTEFTANFSVVVPYPWIYIRKTTPTNDAVIAGYNNNSLRWTIILVTGHSENGSNSGSYFAINAYSDSGAYLGTPFYITRDNMRVVVSKAPIIGENATAGEHAVRKSQMDAAISAAVNTSTILAHTANANVGDVGTYAFLRPYSNQVYGPGSLVAGSDLRYSGAPNEYLYGTAPPGTWRCMGRRHSFTFDESGSPVTSNDGATLWLRVW